MTNPPSRRATPDATSVLSLSDGEVRAWIDGGIHLKAATEFGDPVELSGDEAHQLVVGLERLIPELDGRSTTSAEAAGVAAVQLGFSVADAEVQELVFDGADLVIRLRDWRERTVEYRFVETLAFRWTTTPSLPTPRGDESYVALDSEWLRIEAQADGVAASDFAHYLLCFNAAKILEVISRRGEPKSAANGRLATGNPGDTQPGI